MMDYVSKYVPECVKQIPVYMVKLRLLKYDNCSYKNGEYVHFNDYRQEHMAEVYA